MKNKQKILIVDDYQENLIALSKILADFDSEIVLANSGNEAIKIANKQDVDLILLDVQMPEMNGYETLSIIKMEEKNKYLPVVFLTAEYKGVENKIKGIDAGAVDFLEKPISEELLIGKVKLLLDIQKNKKELEEKSKALEEQKDEIERIKNELQISETQKSALLNNSPDMIEQIDMNNRIVWANQTTLDTFPNIINKMCVFKESDEPCENCPVRKALKTGKFEKNIFTTHKTNISSIVKYWNTIAVPLKNNIGEVNSVLKISRDITERVMMENQIKIDNKKLEKLALYDDLTGVMNRNAFTDLLDKNISRAKRTGHQLALLFLDLEKFKQINDIYGHDTGDKILIAATEKIKKNIRVSDFFGRIGGDEFVICLNDINSPNDPVTVAKKINSTFSEKINIDGIAIDLTVSIGISIFPDDGEKSTDLLKNSDIAMYKAKQKKNNTFQLYDKSHTHEVIIEQALLSGLDNNEYSLHYQPIVNCKGRCISLEALLRWTSTEHGSISPNVFIPILERNKLINKIGAWVFEEACKQIVLINKIKEFKDIIMSVNLSDIQMQDANFVDDFASIMTKTAVDPKNIVLEITEEGGNHNIEKTMKILPALAKKGLKLFALDDFGSGYSSFSSLTKLPIDIVKLDKSLIDNLCSKKYSRTTLDLITLIRNMGFKIIAEGVETKEQFEKLSEKGCEFIQGFYFSKPVPNIYEVLKEKNGKFL